MMHWRTMMQWVLVMSTLAPACLGWAKDLAEFPVGQEYRYECEGVVEEVEMRASMGRRRWQKFDFLVREIALGQVNGEHWHLSLRSTERGEFSAAGALLATINPKTRAVRVVHSPLTESLEETTLALLPPPDRLFLSTPTIKKVGQTWEREERLWWLPVSTVRCRYRVVNRELIGDRKCWVVERTLPNAFGQLTLQRYSERWWIDPQSSLPVWYVLEMASEQTLPFGGKYRLGEVKVRLQLQHEGILPSKTVASLREGAKRLRDVWQRIAALQKQSPEEEMTVQGWETLQQQLQAWMDAGKDEALKNVIRSHWRWVGGTLTEVRRQFQQAQLAKGRFLPAPDFELPDLNGKKVRLSDFRGKVIVLNFFAHW